MAKSEFSERLSYVRTRAGLTQVAFSKRIGISERSYKNYELEHRDLPCAIARKIHSEFGINIHWLLTGEGFVDEITTGEIVEMAVRETRKSLLQRGLSLEPEKEAKVVRYLVQQVREKGELSEQVKKDFFETIS